MTARAPAGFYRDLGDGALLPGNILREAALDLGDVVQPERIELLRAIQGDGRDARLDDRERNGL